MLTVKVTNKMDRWQGGRVTTAREETGMKEAIKLREVTSEAEHNNKETVHAL
jgi:hypothetical protein